MADEKPETRQRGAVTEWRPDDDRVSGGSDHSVQTEAHRAEGSANLANDSATMGGAAGTVSEADRPEDKRSR
jgi:hypothetical protein